MDDELERGFRINPRPWILGAVVNLTLAGVLVGIPYARGPERAEAVLPRFARFAACFYDASDADPPGLGLQRGERARYASLVLRGAPDWPERCRADLRAIPEDETRFLFPGVKSAEAQVRGAVDQLDEELARVVRAREGGELTVSDRTMRAMSVLRAALAELGVASGVAGLSAARDAVSFDDAAVLPTPSIIPMRISIGGPWSVAVEDGALLATAMDRRSVAHARIAGGGIDLRLTRRPPLVSGLLGAREPPWLVWSTPPDACDGDCAQRASGVAALVEDRQTLEPMVWLQAHPAVEPGEGGFHAQGQTAWVVALAEGGTEIRRFTLPEPRVRALGEQVDVPQVVPDATWLVPGASPRVAAWRAGDPPAVILAGEGGARFLTLTPETAPRVVDASGPARIATCGEVAAVGTATSVSLVLPDAVVPVSLALRPPEDRSLQLVCDGEATWVLALSDRAVSAVRCEGASCAAPREIASGVTAFDVVRYGGALLVAWTDHADEGAIRVTRVTGDRIETAVPSPCWSDPLDGPCGEPRIATDGSTVMLVSRDESDFRVLRSADGVTWSSLDGLAQP